MKIKIHRGQNQIGGSIIEIASEHARVIFDVGLEIGNDIQEIPQIEGLFNGEPLFNAVFISHYHADHLGLAKHLLPGINLYMGEKCYQINRFSNEYLGKNTFVSPQVFSHGELIRIGDLTITPLLCDHSAYDSYMFVIESNGKKVLYTGDFRSNGRKSFSSFLEKLPEVDVVITEGTTLDRNDADNLTEAELEKIAVEAIGEHSPVFFLQAATNIDRIVTAYKASRKADLLFLEDLYMAGITSIIGGSIPNPNTFKSVRVFMTGNKEERYNLLLDYGKKRIGRSEIAKNRFAMCIRPSMKEYLEKLSEEVSFDKSILFYSMWSGYKDNDDAAAFLEFMRSKGVKIHSLHTSGHADAATITKLISRAKPKWIIPVHTENAEWFTKFKDSKILLNSDALGI